MTTPPQKLLLVLDRNATYRVYSEESQLLGSISFEQALSLAVSGLIEGIGPRNGIVRSLRMLPESARPTGMLKIICVGGAVELEAFAGESSYGSPMSENTIGAYRQHLPEGHTVYALALLKKTGY